MKQQKTVRGGKYRRFKNIKNNLQNNTLWYNQIGVKKIDKFFTEIIYKINKLIFDKINRGAQWSNIL